MIETKTNPNLEHPTSPTAADPRSAARRSASGRALYLAFAAVVACFVVSSAYAQHTAGSIDRAALDIAGNASPSIEHLASLRSEIRRYSRLVDEYVASGGRGDRAELDGARAQVEREKAAYLSLPFFPDERALWDAVVRSLGAFDRAARDALADASAGQLEEATRLAHVELPRLTDRVSDDIARITSFDAEQSHRLALRIETAHRRSVVVEVVFDALSALVAVLVVTVVRRDARARAALAEEYTSLVERRGEELELFASRVAHDVLSPLGATRIAIESVARRLDDPRMRSQLERGRSALERTTRIVDGLLAFARAGAYPEPSARCDARAVIEGLAGELRPAAEQIGARLDVELEPTPPVACSEGVLTSIVANLVRNAIKYLGDGADRRVTIRAREAGGLVRLEVEDTGPGVPPELGDRVFELYVRGSGASQPGLGLGLATVKRLVEAHAGSVGVRSEPGKGAAFWVELPVAA
jgi:signal transduction histidine kinase